jgi:hypothetical protein
MFDHHLLDMMEFGIQNYKAISDFKASTQPLYGSKPTIVLIGM